MRFTLSDELAVGLKDPLFLIAGQLTGLVPKAEFHHIGATAIPGSLTKGDVDVLLRVEARDFMSAVATLRQHFAINQRENWSDVFASFADYRSFPFPLGVQLVVKGSEADFFLFLVEYFTSNPARLAEYNRIKVESARLGVVEYRNAEERYLSPIIASAPDQANSSDLKRDLAIHRATSELKQSSIIVHENGGPSLFSATLPDQNIERQKGC